MLGRNLSQKETLWRITRFALVLWGLSLAGFAAPAVIALMGEWFSSSGEESAVNESGEESVGKPQTSAETSLDQSLPLTPAVPLSPEMSGENSDHFDVVMEDFLEPHEAPVTSPLGPAGHPTDSPSGAVSENSSIDLAEVDNVILEGRYSLATELLAEYEPRVSELLQSQIRLRQALCAELQGNLPKALKYYRLLTQASEPAVADVATLSAARVLIEMGHSDTGSMMLMRLLLHRERLMARGIRGDVIHTLAASLVPETDDSRLLEDSAWFVGKHSQTPEDLLKSWTELKTVPQPLQSDVFELRELTPSPEGVFVTLRCAPTSPISLLVHVCVQLKWSGRISPEVQDALRTQTVDADCVELPLDVLLDLVLTTHGFDWTFTDKVLTVTPSGLNDHQTPEADNLQKTELRRLVKAERFLHLATELAPEHPAAPLSYVLLGSTAARLGDVDRASRLFMTSFDQFPRSPYAGSAMFNLAKAMLGQGKRDDALIRFYHTVDKATGLDIDSLSYLYIGRILMENDQPREAITPLRRGLELSDGTLHERQAALLLSAAHLLSGDAARANSVLFEHRQAFTSAAARSSEDEERTRELSHQAAFLSSLARFWGTNGTKRIWEGRELLGALTTAHPEKMFGGQSVFLVGVAYGAVGLTSEQEALFQQCLNSPSTFSLQRRMVSLLNGDLNPEDSLKLSNLQASSSPDASAAVTEISRAAYSKVELLTAEAAYRSGDYDKVRQTSLKFLADAAKRESAPESGPLDARESEIRRSMLRLLGLVYQAEGRHEDAVRCFAGVAPEQRTASGDQTSEDSNATGKKIRETL